VHHLITHKLQPIAMSILNTGKLWLCPESSWLSSLGVADISGPVVHYQQVMERRARVVVQMTFKRQISTLVARECNF
jgi:hypothetical protein